MTSSISTMVVRGAAWMTVVAIAILSLVPSTFRPHVTSSDKLEHFAAYFVLGALFVLGYPRRPTVILLASLLFAYAALLEAGQLFVPGRSVSLADFVWSAFGVMAGIATAVAARRISQNNMPVD